MAEMKEGSKGGREQGSEEGWRKEGRMEGMEWMNECASDELMSSWVLPTWQLVGS